MKTAIAIAAAAVTLTCIPLLAQQSETASPANDSAKVTYAATAGGFGDQAASHAWEMSAVAGELDGKLDSKTAKVGDRVGLKTTEKVQTSDGTVIPGGSRLVGHVTEVQAYDKEIGPARIAIAFDHVELKNGQSIAIHSLIRGVNPSASALAASQLNDDQTMNMGGGRMGVGQGTGYGLSGAGSGGVNGTPGGAGALAGTTLDRTSGAAASASEKADASLGSTVDTATQGSGGSSADTGAHGVAAARAVPHETGIPGVMLAGNSFSSGMLLASRKNIQFESGTQMQLGIVADR